MHRVLQLFFDVPLCFCSQLQPKLADHIEKLFFNLSCKVAALSCIQGHADDLAGMKMTGFFF